jgi:hypothetical protein
MLWGVLTTRPSEMFRLRLRDSRRANEPLDFQGVGNWCALRSSPRLIAAVTVGSKRR